MSVYCTACVALRVRCTSFFGGWAYMFVEGASACPSAASIFVYSRNQQPNRSTHMFFISIFFFLFFFCLSTPISQADFVYSSKSLISRPRLPNPSDETAARLGVVSIPSNRSLVAELFSEFRVTLNVDLPPAVWKRSWSCC